MTSEDPRLATIAGWVGRSYAEMRCWDVIRSAYRLRDVNLPSDYYASIALFETVFDPEPWDVIAICNHRLAIANHVGLYLGDGEFIHSLEGDGVVIGRLDRAPWRERIARTRPTEHYPDGRPGFLRFRS
jgi:cell wall-associated NlpC family hydrolase